MAINPKLPQLTEPGLNAPDLDDDGTLDVEHYQLPSADEIEDPYLAGVWSEAAKLVNGPLDDDDDDDEDD